MIKTANAKLTLGPGMRPLQRDVVDRIAEAFKAMTDAEMVSAIRFVGYDEGRTAIYEAQFDVLVDEHQS